MQVSPDNTSHSLAAVDDDIFRLDPFLQHSLLGMLSSPSEQTRRLQLKIPDAFSVAIQQAVAIFIHDLLIGIFLSLRQTHSTDGASLTGGNRRRRSQRREQAERYLLLLFAQSLPGFHLVFMEGVEFFEVTLLQICDH